MSPFCRESQPEFPEIEQLNFTNFGILAALLTVLAAIFFVPVFIDYLNTGLVDKFPTLIVCGFVIISAIISLF